MSILNNPKLREFITNSEGYRSDAYWDSAGGKWTIGYGHTHNVHPGDHITQDQADQFFMNDIANNVNHVSKWQYYNDLTDNQKIALISFAYNGGNGMFDQLVKNGRTPDQLPQYMINYNHGAGGKVIPGLTARRQREIDLFNSAPSDQQKKK